jgi:hypothetical protein
MSASRPGRYTLREMMARCVLNRRLGGLHSRFESFGKGLNFLPLLGIEPRFLVSRTLSLLTVP